MISYALYWLIQLPCVLMGPNKGSLRYLFRIKSILCPICGLAMLVWAIKKGGREIFNHHSNLSGQDLGYQWLSGVNAAIGNYVRVSFFFFIVFKKTQRRQFCCLCTTSSSLQHQLMVTVCFCVDHISRS